MAEAVIVGPDHPNTLSIIRSLGVEKINFFVIYHSARHKMGCNYSRFIKKNYAVVPNEEKALLDYLLETGKKQDKRIPVFPTSDYAAYCIDKNAEELEKYYFCPGIPGLPGKICELMDKYRQFEFAVANHIKMAYTWKIPVADTMYVPENIKYPVILKPYISAKGSKNDIIKCRNEIELKEAGERLKQKYDLVLMQEFVIKDYEMTVIGAALNRFEKSMCVIHKLCIYPKVGGSMTYAFVEDKVPEEIEEVIDKLQEMGYTGLFDLEFFKVGNAYYLNEINFRSSGVNACALSNGVNDAYRWFLYVNGEQYDHLKRKVDGNWRYQNLMNDYMLKRTGELTCMEFLRHLVRTDCYDVLWIRDIPGSIGWYWNLISRKIFRL